MPSFHVIRAAVLTVASATAWLAAAPGATGLSTVINNGLAPPNPANVISSSIVNGAVSGLYVQNVGCDWNVLHPCASPGAPTTVALIEGAYVGRLEVHESSTVTISGPPPPNYFPANAEPIVAYDSSTVTMSGGGTYSIQAYDSSTVTMSGGQTAQYPLDGGGAIYAAGSSSVTISGGNFYSGTFFWANNSAHLTVVGTGFAVDGTPVGYGPLAASDGVLTGTLQSGEHLDNTFSRTGGGIISVSAPPACQNGLDDDGDGFTDYPSDPGCHDATSNTESPACQDGIDNDFDGKFDFDGGASANHGVALGPLDPQCTQPWRNSEVSSCGLGAELVLLLPLLGVARRRRGGLE